MKEKFTVWDPADYVKTPEDVFAYIEAALEENDPPFLLRVLDDIDRSKGMAKLTAKYGVTIDDIRKAFTSGDVSSFVCALSNMGFQMTISPKPVLKPKRVRAVSKKLRTTPHSRIASGKRIAKTKAQPH